MKNSFCIDEIGLTAKIRLGKHGSHTIIDAEDLPVAQSCRTSWVCHKAGPCLFYARYMNDDGKAVYLHRILMGNPPLVDHKDGDSLNNRRGNLRVSNKSKNGLNRVRPHKARTSGVRGVKVFPGRQKPYRAEIFAQGKVLRLGYFETEREAESCVLRKVSELIAK
jgi:hypothetical protein